MDELKEVKSRVEELLRGKYVDDVAFAEQSKDLMKLASSRQALQMISNQYLH